MAVVLILATGYKFTIPMRGNELCDRHDERNGAVWKFTFPMRVVR